MSQASTLELLMVDLINEERTAAGVPPLTVDNDLNTSSETHSAWMLENDVFSHQGAGGSSSTDRIRDAGYALEGNWTTGENIGWQSERGDAGLEDDVRAIHESLMNSPEHRANILNPDFDEVGIGIEQGDFDAATGTFDAVMVTQNFGRTDADDVSPEQDGGPAQDGGISAAPEVMTSDDEPDDGMPTEDPVMAGVDDDPVIDEPDDDTAGGNPVVAGPGDDDPVTEVPTDEMPEDDPVAADDDDAVITRDFVITQGSISNTVTETVTIAADGTTTRTRTEAVTDAADDDMTISFDDLSDVFDFGSFDLDGGGTGITVSDAEFSFAGPDGTVTTDDPVEFEALLAEFFGETPDTPSCTDALFV